MMLTMKMSEEYKKGLNNENHMKNKYKTGCTT
jgi:hypothetical protein